MKSIILVVIFMMAYHRLCFAKMPSCDSLVYCQGDLLDTVQRAGIFRDSKTFVDMMQLNSPKKTLQNFAKLKKETKNKPTKHDIKRFVDENFSSQGELESWHPKDHSGNPAFLNRIENAVVKRFAKVLVDIWPHLARKVNKNVVQSPDRHSLIYVPQGFIVPGGRFREIYYWDTYWIIKGLLVCDMLETVKGMLENFFSLVTRFGFVPNGSRIYYLNRSQPPLLAMMVGLYMDATDNIHWLRRNIHTIDKELRWWLDNRIVTVVKNGTKYNLARYRVNSGSPRPESYIEDKITCGWYRNEKQKKDCYRELKSGAESGWDFSSRWMFKKGGNLTDLQTSRVVPVDLNAFLCKDFEEISRFYLKIGKPAEASEWKKKADAWKEAIEMVFYDEADDIWYDYDLKLSQTRKSFFPTNFAPLWTRSYQRSSGKRYGSRATAYAKKLRLDHYKGGVPTSLTRSGEQWDMPNAWPPLQEMVIYGLKNSGDQDAMRLARKISRYWIESNMIGYRRSGDIFEMYDAICAGQYGAGGEYIIQTGFGWTNGVVLTLIKEYHTVTSGGSLWTRMSNTVVYMPIICTLLAIQAVDGSFYYLIK